MHDDRRGRARRCSPTLTLALPLVLLTMAPRCSKPAPSSGTGNPSAPISEARIVVHPSQVGGEISPLIFGAGLEWTENGNRVFDRDAGRIRPDVVGALVPLRIPVVRFPGGILADHYQWKDAIGPRQARPRRRNPMDDSEHENNFGTDEFIDFCRQLGAEPLITANAGTGSLEDALAWQRYFAERRFPVKYWEIGNEIYLAEPRQRASIPGNDKRIYKTASEYAALLDEWAPAIKRQDGAALVGAIAGTYNTSAENKGWLDALLKMAPDRMDFVALHDSFAPLIFSRYDYADGGKRADAYRAMFAAARSTEEDLRSVRERLRTSRTAGPRLAVTEHFPLFGAGSHEQLVAGLDQSRTLAAALYTASLFNVYVREQIWMANYNLITSKWFGALLTDTDAGLVRTPTYHLWDLYRNHLGDQSVGVDVTTPSFDSRAVGAIAARAGVGYLDAVATRDRQGSIYLAVINRNLSQDMQTVVQVDGVRAGVIVDILTLNGPSANSINGPPLTRTTEGGGTDNVKLEALKWTMTATPYRLPAHSVTVMKWAGK